MALWGGYNYLKLPIDAVPDITNNQVQVITSSPSLAPQEVEQFITFPVEVAMANLQDVVEIRSISRYGLSVVTIVFKDKVNSYLARQLVSEQMKVAEGQIPRGYGTPEMMPVTTGLGEIFQYTIKAKPGYEGVYTPDEVRTVQDWIVRRQLSGIPGIVEINSFGGQLKQYEVAVSPRQLVGMDISITEIFEALEANNANTGGSYIEKGPDAYYIRTDGLARDADDISGIVLKNIDGVAVTIGDVARVTTGYATRFGAMTQDGKGEAVGGITMLLKGANASQVVERVKERIERIQGMLPPGLEIKPYLDRTELINRAIGTVSKNLVEGGLIVIFVLVLLLGNFRAGLIVASVIPLSMLFAFSMMNLFGVSANLMSLGAIDFGLIVDGSVIVTEGIIHRLEKSRGNGLLTRHELNNHVFLAGSEVSKSAVFGVFIILLVYIPILAFQGIEGKMFRPMAQTVSFALVGAMILSLTYVPVVASLTLSLKPSGANRGLASRLISFLNRSHHPVLLWALQHKAILLGAVVVVLIASFGFFSRMGGEFIPTLDEGDLAAQMTLPPGSSLSQSIAMSTRAEQILMKTFPEVRSVVSKIGTAEVPTDPMAVEDADIMIAMKPRDEWTSASSREEMADKMKEALAVIPGVAFEFSQPIQLRFNELMTGVKSDVAVKIYGDDLELLHKKATEAASSIAAIAGAGDVRVEQIVGLPQLVVRYRRDQLARYGLTVDEVNRVVRASFAGEVAGVVFEGEKRFDLVVRLDKEYRNDLRSLGNLRVNRPDQELVLLSQVADIQQVSGPMQISRDDTKRRITIGINVRNRDIESFVDEVSQTLAQHLVLPPGYYVTYGGQFENLKAARRTSSIAVPIALAAIFVMLFFAFYSLKQAFMIFTAIPMAAVGGIWALALRGMPFSISAGVGFIALFGVAVLNGIVLLSHYNHLEREGITDLLQRVINGTRDRLRPVVMTASVAALGFFPMALSTAAGAEVQKPLATVVIGGLVTSTFLTLVVLPVLYVLFNQPFRWSKAKSLPLILLLVVGSASYAHGQKEPLSFDQAKLLMTERNITIVEGKASLEVARQARSTAFNLPRPQLTWEQGQINSALTDHHFSVSQEFDFPGVYIARRKKLNHEARAMSYNLTVDTQEALSELSRLWLELDVLTQKVGLLQSEDSLYRQLASEAAQRFNAGDRQRAAVLRTRLRHEEAKMELKDTRMRILDVEVLLLSLLNLPDSFAFQTREVTRWNHPLFGQLPDASKLPRVMALDESGKALKAGVSEARNRALPGITAGWFSQSIDRTGSFTGWQIGLTLPVWFWNEKVLINQTKIELELGEARKGNYIRQVNNDLLLLQGEIDLYDEKLDLYENELLPMADTLLADAREAWQAGDTERQLWLATLAEALTYKKEYLDLIYNHNLRVIEAQKLSGILIQ